MRYDTVSGETERELVKNRIGQYYMALMCQASISVPVTEIIHLSI